MLLTLLNLPCLFNAKLLKKMNIFISYSYFDEDITVDLAWGDLVTHSCIVETTRTYIIDKEQVLRVVYHDIYILFT